MTTPPSEFFADKGASKGATELMNNPGDLPMKIATIPHQRVTPDFYGKKWKPRLKNQACR